MELDTESWSVGKRQISYCSVGKALRRALLLHGQAYRIGVKRFSLAGKHHQKYWSMLAAAFSRFNQIHHHRNAGTLVSLLVGTLVATYRKYWREPGRVVVLGQAFICLAG